MRLFKGPGRTVEDPAAMHAIVTIFQNYVQQADGKAGVLVVIHTAAVAAAIAPGRAAAELDGAGAAVGYVLLALFLLGFLVSGYHVLRVLWPRLTPPGSPSRYGITGVVNGPPADAAAFAEPAEAWAMVRLLAEIAQCKHRHIRRALPWTGLALVSVVSWAMVAIAWP
ncbi:hypothetical protein AB0K60_35060 [Thermopolyspora sp. NPDC052614]|uniref:hypothetical protein n=1 Tax=Thermopolyspora sp. NPDC052614 TaxID=3155682 RepID=UPI00342F1BAB